MSTRARNIELSAEDFNNYLEHDGVIDMLNWRKENNALESDAVEKYSKHVKAIFQVGEKRTDDWKVNLGYPIEFIPLNNPYDLHTGDQLSVQLLRAGEPLTDQLVYVDSEISPFGHTHDEETTHSHSDETHSHDESNKADHDHDADDHAHDHGNGHVHETGNEHSHAHEKEPTDSHSHSHEHDENGNHVHNEDEEHSHNEGIQLRTNADGVVSFKLASDGIWYMRTIHLVPIEEEGLTHESNWATLTLKLGTIMDLRLRIMFMKVMMYLEFPVMFIG